MSALGLRHFFQLCPIEPQECHLRFQGQHRRAGVHLPVHWLLLSHRLFYRGGYFLAIFRFRHDRGHLFRARDPDHDIEFPRHHAASLQHVHMVHCVFHRVCHVWSFLPHERPTRCHFR